MYNYEIQQTATTMCRTNTYNSQDTQEKMKTNMSSLHGDELSDSSAGPVKVQADAEAWSNHRKVKKGKEEIKM